MNIDRFARWYRWVEYAAFGRALERRRFAFLHRLANARRVLILGEGDGRALSRLLALAPHAEIDVVELSGEMIELARARVANSPRVHFLRANALTMAWPTNHYDAVVTLFFLDCFNEADAVVLIQQLARVIAPNGLWLVSEFAVPQAGWRRWHAKAWIWIMYRVFGATTGLRTRSLPPIERLLTEAGLVRSEWEAERCGLIQSEIWRTARLDPNSPVS